MGHGQLGGRRRVRGSAAAAVATAVVAAAVTLAVVLSGCSTSREEPGLFRPQPAPTKATSSLPQLPEPTNRQLPVLGEQVWTTGEGLSLTVRFAVHAVRRIAGATILDWSVTPLASAGLAVGDAVPSTVDLGLQREDDGDQRIYLLDGAGHVYRPLAHKRQDVFHHCLCTPLWVNQLDLVVGETRLMQLALAPVPPGVDHVDVSMPNTMPFWHIPVMPEGTVPLATRSVDLTRPADRAPAASAELAFTESDEPLGRRRSITLLDVQTGADETVLTWRIRSREDQPFPAFSFGSPPVSEAFGATADLRSTDVASGPALRVTGGRGSATSLGALWSTSDQPAPGYRECLCSHFGLWAAGLRFDGGAVTVSTAYAPLPPDTRFIDVVMPGLATVSDVPVTETAIDADRAVLGVGRITERTWTYSTAEPPAGWLTSDWPTPTPDPSELKDYTTRVDRIVDLHVS